MTGDNKYEININNAENGGVSMCTVAQNLENIGEKKGENKLASLINKMIADNKADDITKVTSDESIREDYYKMYNIV
jgi:hypothetical protein